MVVQEKVMLTFINCFITLSYGFLMLILHLFQMKTMRRVLIMVLQARENVLLGVQK